MSRLALFLFLIFSQLVSTNNKHQPISLKDERFTFIPQKFYINHEADARSNRSEVAILIQKNKKDPVAIDLKHGAVESMKNFLDHNLHRDTTLRPILVTIKEFKITETQLPDGRIRGNLKVFFSFSSQLSYQNKHLVDFNKEYYYNRQIDKPINAEAKLRGGIMDGLTYFNDWMNR